MLPMFAPPGLWNMTAMNRLIGSAKHQELKKELVHSSGINANFHDGPQGVRYSKQKISVLISLDCCESI